MLNEREKLEQAALNWLESKDYKQNNCKIEINIDKQKKSFKIKTELYE